MTDGGSITKEQLSALRDLRIRYHYKICDNATKIVLNDDGCEVDVADLASLALAGLRAQWQPIETAPRVPDRIWIGGPGWKLKGWIRSDGMPMHKVTETPDATHWMPLPEPPEVVR